MIIDSDNAGLMVRTAEGGREVGAKWHLGPEE